MCGFSYLADRKVEIGPAKMANFSAFITKNPSLDAPNVPLMPQIVIFHRFGAFVDILACANRRSATNAEKVCDFLPR